MERVDLAPLPAGTASGWYPDPSVHPLIRFWDGGSWTDLTYVGPAQDADGRFREYHPLSRGPRPSHWRTFGIFVLYLLPPIALTALGDALVNSPTLLWTRESSLSYLIVVVYWALLARRVDYRWFDVLFVLIPVYGFIWAVIVVWRNAKLPYRNWRPRGEVLLADSAFAVPPQTSGVVEGDAERS